MIIIAWIKIFNALNNYHCNMFTVEDKLFNIVLVKYYISNKMIKNDIIKYKILYLIIINIILVTMM